MEENNNNENKIVEKGKQVAKDAVKNVAKETMKKILPAVLPAIGWFVLIILAMGLINLVTYMITSWFTSIFHPKKADTAGEDEVKSVISINQYGGYDINTDNFAEQVLKELENKHVSTELMGYTDDESEDSKNEEDSATTEKEQEKEQEKLKKDLNSMIDKYVKAEVQTMYPRTGRYGDVDGLITIKKMSAETGKTKTLTYITYDEFNNRNDSALCNCFSLEPETFKLWIATETKTEYYMYNGTDEGNKVDTKSDINKISYDYKTSVQGYGIPFNFLISLHNTVQEKKFMKEVVKQILAKNEPIVLTFVESSAKTTILKEYDGKQWVEVTNTAKPPENAPPNLVTPSTTSVEDDVTISDSNINNFSNYLEEDYYWKKVTTTNSGSWVVTKADTLFKKIERTIELNNRPGSPGEPQTEEIVNKGERLPDEEDDISIKKKIKRTIINETTTVSSQNSYFTIVDSVKKLNVDEFIDLIKKYPKAENNLTSAPSNFIYLLQQNEDTQQLEQIMRYVLFKLTGEDYGVTSLDLDILFSEQLKRVTGSSTENYIKAWENCPLWKYETKQSASVPTRYLTEDGENYIVYEDGSNGHNNVSYGLATFITDSTNAKVEHPIYGGGYYNNKDAFEKEGIFVDTLYTGALVNREKGTVVFQNILAVHQKAVEDYLKDKLPEYKFSQAQKDALIAVHYQYGNIYGFVDAYKASLNDDGTIDAEKIKVNFAVDDGNGGRIHVFNYTGVTDRKYANWLLFTEETYIDRDGNEIEVLGGDIVSTAKIIHDYMSDPDHLYYYCLNGGSDYEYVHRGEGLSCGLASSFADSQVPGNTGYRLTCCATYVSWVLQELGYIEGHWDNTGIKDALSEPDWTRIDNYDDLEAGDIVFMDTEEPYSDKSLDHVQIYVGDGCWYNAGGNTSIHRVEPYSDDVRNQFIYAYRKN